jgi:hypothetical protein
MGRTPDNEGLLFRHLLRKLAAGEIFANPRP